MHWNHLWYWSWSDCYHIPNWKLFTCFNIERKCMSWPACIIGYYWAFCYFFHWWIYWKDRRRKVNLGCWSRGKHFICNLILILWWVGVHHLASFNIFFICHGYFSSYYAGVIGITELTSAFDPLRVNFRGWKFVSPNILTYLEDICKKKICFLGNFFFP